MGSSCGKNARRMYRQSCSGNNLEADWGKGGWEGLKTASKWWETGANGKYMWTNPALGCSTMFCFSIFCRFSLSLHNQYPSLLQLFSSRRRGGLRHSLRGLHLWEDSHQVHDGRHPSPWEPPGARPRQLLCRDYGWGPRTLAEYRCAVRTAERCECFTFYVVMSLLLILLFSCKNMYVSLMLTGRFQVLNVSGSSGS